MIPTGFSPPSLQAAHRRGGVVEVAVAGEEGGAGVVAGRPADGVGEAGAVEQPLGGGDRGADPLQRGGDEAPC